MNRQAAWDLLCEYTKSENLRKHALAVEACLAAYARKFGEEEEKWAVVGLIHDFDYELYPSAPDHPLKGSEILKEKGVSEEMRRAILGHADYTGVARDTLLAKALYACDELREDNVKGAEELGLPLDEHITFCIAAMRSIADQLGLAPAESAPPTA
jgi:putative nucleotidyltransferase with HDIG domain